MTPMNPRIIAAWISVALVGCDDGVDGTGDPTEDNLRQYEALRLQLEQARTQVLPADRVDDVRAAGPWLVWLDIYQGFAGELHARRYPDGAEVAPEVPIGDEQTAPNFEVGETLGMTALTVGGDAQYTVFRLDTGAVLDVVTWPKPTAARYDAYGVFGEQAYVVVEDEDLAVYAWTPGTDAPTRLGALGETDASLGAWAGFVVVEDLAGARRLIGVGTYGTYSFDLATFAATRVPLPLMPLAGAINEHGVGVADDRELWWYGWGDAEARPIHEELAASTYLLNSTYAMAHLPSSLSARGDVSVAGTTLYYRSNSGIYAYDVETRAVAPVLLDDNNYAMTGLFVRYTGVLTGDGALYAVGLESDNGAIGVDGPVYRVEL